MAYNLTPQGGNADLAGKTVVTLDGYTVTYDSNGFARQSVSPNGDIKYYDALGNETSVPADIRVSPVNDPQAVRDPRPDISYFAGGNSGLYTSQTASLNSDNAGTPSDGSRQIQWGWAPVGGARANDAGITPNYLVSVTSVGTVTVTTT